MSVAPSITWPLVAISPSERMKNPVPIPRTGDSLGAPLPDPYMRSRKSWNGSPPPTRAVVAMIPTTAGIAPFTTEAIEAGGAVGLSLGAGASVQIGFAASSRASRGVMRARVWTPARQGQWRLLLDHAPDQLLRRGVGRARRAPRVEQDAELVFGLRFVRRGTAHGHVAEEHRDHLPGTLRVAFAARGQCVEHRGGARRLPGHRGGRSEERRVGKECRSRRGPWHEKKKGESTRSGETE